MAVLEKIRGKPHNVKVLEFIMTGCVALVMGFIIYISCYDIQELPIFDRFRVKQVESSTLPPPSNPKP